MVLASTQLRLLIYALLISHPPSPLLTKLSILHTVSVGCAPTPSQYFARDRSSAMSLYALAVLASLSDKPVGLRGTGL